MDVSEDSLKEARKIWSFPITSSELAAGLLSLSTLRLSWVRSVRATEQPPSFLSQQGQPVLWRLSGTLEGNNLHGQTSN